MKAAPRETPLGAVSFAALEESRASVGTRHSGRAASVLEGDAEVIRIEPEVRSDLLPGQAVILGRVAVSIELAPALESLA